MTKASSYLNQVKIPEGKSGDHEIEHFTYPAGKKLNTSNLRTQMIGGQPNAPVTFKKKTTWHRLKYDGGVWMTDLPIEQEQHRHEIKDMRGHVLVGGLGLGLAVNWLAKRKTVKSITVVEISKDVIDLVAKHIIDPKGKVNVVQDDLKEFLKLAITQPVDYDWAFYDIWQSDGESTFFQTVCPLRELSVGIVPDHNVVCWNENVMRGQLFFSLQTRLMQIEFSKQDPKMGVTIDKLAEPEEDNIWLKWCAPFFKMVRDSEMEQEEILEAMKEYAVLYGRPGWEKRWERYMEFA